MRHTSFRVPQLLPFQVDLEAADREVDRLEHTVAYLRERLHETRRCDGGGGDGSNSEEKNDMLVSPKRREDQCEVREASSVVDRAPVLRG